MARFGHRARTRWPGLGADAAAVLAAFDTRVARYKRPHDVVFVDALPRNALGKVEVARLRALVNGDGSTSAT